AVRPHLLQGPRPREVHRLLHQQDRARARPPGAHRRRRDQRLLRRPGRPRAPAGTHPQPRPGRALRARDGLQPRRLRRRGPRRPVRQAGVGRRRGVREQAPRHGQRHAHLLCPRPGWLPHRVYRAPL
ncbi:MAG: Lactoylglutathione lyase, partial [uncultured Rubrobacteraceae bacterium]